MVEFIGIGIGVVGLAVAVFATIKMIGLQRRFAAAFGNNETDSLERTLSQHLKRVEEVDVRLDKLTKAYEELALTSSFASQKISIVRFNPFGDTGGDQSFSLAVLDSHDSGYVLTSIHGREGTRVYVKPVDYGKTSKYTLSDEEQQALSQAIKRVPQV
jgi:hypothetical protein